MSDYLETLTSKEKANELISLLDIYFSPEDFPENESLSSIEDKIYKLLYSVGNNIVTYEENNPEETLGNSYFLYMFMDYDFSIIYTREDFDIIIEYIKSLPSSITGMDFNS